MEIVCKLDCLNLAKNCAADLEGTPVLDISDIPTDLAAWGSCKYEPDLYYTHMLALRQRQRLTNNCPSKQRITTQNPYTMKL